jgi:hypothetical protein
MAEATFEVFCPGILDVLSIGKGDLRLDVGGSPEDRERAKDLIGEMLEKGYSIFVETDDGPVRVMGFIASSMSYLIVDADTEPAPPDKPDAKPAKRKSTRKKVPVEGSKATAVGRSAGG